MKAVRKIEQLLAATLFVMVCILFTLAQKDSKKLDSLYKKAIVERHAVPSFPATSKR